MNISIFKQPVDSSMSLGNEIRSVGFRYAQNLNLNTDAEGNLDSYPRDAVGTNIVFDAFPTTKSGVPSNDSYHFLYAGSIATSVDYVLYLSRINTTQATLNVCFFNTAVNTLFTIRPLTTFTVGSTLLRDCYETCIGFGEREQLFFVFILASLSGAPRIPYGVNIRKSLVSLVTSAAVSVFEANDGLTGLATDTVTGTLLRNGVISTNVLTFVSKNASLTETSACNYSNYRFSTNVEAFPSLANNYQMLVAVGGELTSAVYYPLSSWVADIPRVQNTSESRLPLNLSRRFFSEEPVVNPIYVVSEPASFVFVGDGRLGNSVVTGGTIAERTYTSTEGGTLPESPVTATNNRFIVGSNFLSFAANWTPASITMRGVTRPRYFYTISNALSNLVLTENATPHFMYSMGAVGTDVFAFGNISSAMVGGFLFNGSFLPRGNVVSFVRIKQQLTNPLNTRTPVQRSTYVVTPYSSGFRINDLANNELVGNDNRYMPIFGIDTTKIVRMFKLGNRMAVTLDDGSLYLSTLGITHPNYPPIFDFQVKLDGTPATDNAVKVELESQATGIVEIPDGYLITTNNGLYNYNSALNVVNLVKPGNYSGVVNNDGILDVFSASNVVYSFYYDDRAKTLVQKTSTTFPINVEYYNATAIYRYQDYPLNVQGRVCGCGTNWMTFINKSVLNKYVYECAYAQPIYRYVATVANSESNYTFPPLRRTAPVPFNSLTQDNLALSSVPSWNSAVIGTSTATDVRQYGYNFVTTMSPGNATANGFFNFTSASGVMPFYSQLLTTRQSYGELIGNPTIKEFRQRTIDLSFNWLNNVGSTNLSYFPTYYRNSTVINTSTSNFFFEFMNRAFTTEFTAVARSIYNNTSHFIQWNNGALSDVRLNIEPVK